MKLARLQSESLFQNIRKGDRGGKKEWRKEVIVKICVVREI